MRNPIRLRELVRHCRSLLSTAANRELVSQLQQWAVECDRRADTAERMRPSQQASRYRLRAKEYRVTAEQMCTPAARASFQRTADTYEAMARGLEHVAQRSRDRRRDAG